MCCFAASSLSIRVEGLPRTTVISTGQHILIEGDDEENPYVARVLRLFGDGESDSVQPDSVWFSLRVQTVARWPNFGHSVTIFFNI